MASWAIGDIQGCLNAFERLLDAIYQQDTDPMIYCCGDLVNRGEDSLGVLRLIRRLSEQSRLKTVLGNHDLYALGCVAGFLKPKSSDTLQGLLNYPQEWVDWLRYQPLALDINQTFLMTHGGVWHSWAVKDLFHLTEPIEAYLRSENWKQALQTLWQGDIRVWDNHLSDLNKHRFTINALMRMRLIAPDGSLDFKLKESVDNIPQGYTPWFQYPSHTSVVSMKERILVCGHWSALGLNNQPRLITLDTGCVWGRHLTAVELLSNSQERRIIQVKN